jgi:hypothetical protein
MKSYCKKRQNSKQAKKLSAAATRKENYMKLCSLSFSTLPVFYSTKSNKKNRKTATRNLVKKLHKDEENLFSGKHR